MARRGLAVRDLATEDTLERRLDIGGPAQFGRPRAASEASSAASQAATWTGRRSSSVSMVS